jgi:hypothetical protein
LRNPAPRGAEPENPALGRASGGRRCRRDHGRLAPYLGGHGGDRGRSPSGGFDFDYHLGLIGKLILRVLFVELNVMRRRRIKSRCIRALLQSHGRVGQLASTGKFAIANLRRLQPGKQSFNVFELIHRPNCHDQRTSPVKTTIPQPNIVVMPSCSN